MPSEQQKLEVTVRLMGKGSEILKSKDPCAEPCHDIKVQVSEATPRNILQEIAKQNPLIADQIIRADGTPRSSTKILVGGKPPRDLDEKLATRRVVEADIIIIIFTDDIVIIIFLPCDG